MDRRDKVSIEDTVSTKEAVAPGMFEKLWANKCQAGSERSFCEDIGKEAIVIPRLDQRETSCYENTANIFKIYLLGRGKRSIN